MSVMLSAFLSHADKLPIVGTPLGNATSKFLATNHLAYHRKDSSETLYEQNDATSYRLTPSSTPVTISPPPPYDNDHSSAFNKLSGYVWKRASFGSQGDSSTTPKARNLKINTQPQPQAPPALDKEQVEHAVTMINIATEMDNSGNHQMAMDLYMMGLDRIIAALPLDTDPAVKKSFEEKIKQFKDLKNLDLGLAEMRAQYEASLASGIAGKPASSVTFSDLVVSAVVLSAVALKKSPVPVAFQYALAYAKAGLLAVDDKWQIRRFAMSITSYGINKAIELDQRFAIHQMVTDAICTFCTALIKAGIAYSETPGYAQQPSDTSN